MAKMNSPLDIMNLLGSVADQKSRLQPAPNDEEDPMNSQAPKSGKSPSSTKAKKVAASKEQEKAKGLTVPKTNKPGAIGME